MKITVMLCLVLLVGVVSGRPASKKTFQPPVDAPWSRSRMRPFHYQDYKTLMLIFRVATNHHISARVVWYSHLVRALKCSVFRSWSRRFVFPMWRLRRSLYGKKDLMRRVFWNVKLSKLRFFILFIAAVWFIFLIKLRWPKTKKLLNAGDYVHCIFTNRCALYRYSLTFSMPRAFITVLTLSREFIYPKYYMHLRQSMAIFTESIFTKWTNQVCTDGLVSSQVHRKLLDTHG